MPTIETKKKIKTFLKALPERSGIVAPKIRRKICFIITSRIHYARQEVLLRQLRDDPDLELQLVVGGSALLEKYSEVPAALERNRYVVHEKMLNLIEGGNHVAMAKTAGLAVLELTNTFEKLNPDIVLIRGDRFEQLAAAMTAAYLNKTVAHIEGGDVSGNIDESVRHAITKLAHIHFVTNEPARRRVLQMGEHPEYVFNVGSPDIEFAASVKREPDLEMMNRIGVGGHIDPAKPYIMVMQHPVTSEQENLANVTKTLEAVHALGIQALWFWPNADAGTDATSKGIRRFRETHPTPHIRFVIDIHPKDFTALLRNAACLIGNSSSGIKEAGLFGTPAVNVGNRQQGRLRGPNVADVGYDAAKIRALAERQIAHGKYPPFLAYYKQDTSKLIRKVLKTAPLYTQKRFMDLPAG